MAEKKLMLIVNPNAGRKRGKKLAPKVIEWLRDGGFTCRMFITKKKRRRHAICAAKQRGIQCDCLHGR